MPTSLCEFRHSIHIHCIDSVFSGRFRPQLKLPIGAGDDHRDIRIRGHVHQVQDGSRRRGALKPHFPGNQAREGRFLNHREACRRG